MGRICSERAKNKSNAESGLPATRVRPQRIAARRQRELMCVVRQMENEEFEWLDEDDVDSNGLDMPPPRVVEKGTPVISTRSRKPVWQEDQ